MKTGQLKKQKKSGLLRDLNRVWENNPGIKKDFVKIDGRLVPRWTGEFWSNKQRHANSLHEISYRACFKAQLPGFFIQALTKPGDIIYDPFNGRGTTSVEAALQKRRVIGNDINPLSRILAEPRLAPPTIKQIEARLKKIPINYRLKGDLDLSMFYEKRTLAEVISLKKYFLSGTKRSPVDKWIRMVATNRLTGHSTNFFSVYTMPPNLSVSPVRQIKINKKKKQQPTYKNVKEIILKKSKDLLKDLDTETAAQLKTIAGSAVFLNKDARNTKAIKANSVQLTVTSPPFLNIVQYADDNWLRNWFNGIESSDLQITMSKTVSDWSNVMFEVLKELYRITKRGGFVAFEVGELHKGKVKLDEITVPLGLKAGFSSAAILINDQQFTKTANIWGISNNSKGTNTNRIVLFGKEF